MNKIHLAALISVLLIPVVGNAELRLANIFGNQMVLQRNKPVKVWGWGAADNTVNVEFGKHAASGKVDKNGQWMVQLPKMIASKEPRSLIVTSGNHRFVIEDVLVGDVWLCGGQSNMEWTLRGSRDADLEIPSADFPAIRFIRIPKVARSTPQSDFPSDAKTKTVGIWRKCTSEQVENCTAVGYYFAKRIHRRLRVPIGLVDTSWGGTMAQHWVTQETLRRYREVDPYFESFEAAVSEWQKGGGEEGAKKRLANDLSNWQEAQEKAKSEGKRSPRRPNPNNYTNPEFKRQPGGMINGLIMPLAHCAFKGVLFYQGENNSFSVSWKPFPKTFPAVISDWRRIFKDSDLPFGLVQIAGWSNRRSMRYDMNHHTNIVREVQFKTWRQTKGAGLIVTFDTNSSQSIHPGRKSPVGERLARWALAEVYGVSSFGSQRKLQWKGPVYKSMKQEESRIRLSFEDGTAEGLVLDQDVDVGFYIAGEDRKFHHARARVDKGQVIVWSDSVAKPVAVRYGWSNLPAGGLMNRRELPAYPFRTDKWPLTPHQSTGSYDITKE